MNRAITFIMCDVYEFIQCIYMYLLKIYTFFMYNQVPLVVKRAETICLNSGSSKDITKEISSGKPFKYPSDNSIVKIFYQFSFKDYAMIYHKSSPLKFPPYDLTTFHKRPRPGIASITIENNDFTDILKPYAGPKQNFYTDTENFKGFNFHWTKLHETHNVNVDSDIIVMNTYGVSNSIPYSS